MPEVLGFNTFRSGEATPTVLRVLGLRGAPRSGGCPLTVFTFSSVLLYKACYVSGSWEKLKYLLILFQARLDPRKPSLSPYPPAPIQRPLLR